MDTERQNALNFWNYLRTLFETEDRTDHLFYVDYLSKGDDFKWFYKELKKNEPQLDLSTLLTEDERDQVLDNILNGYAESGLVLRMVDGLTDKYHGDGIINYGK